MEQTTPHGEQARQFTRDDCSRIAACTVNAVLEKLAIRQIVEGFAVFPAGEGVLLVDVVMRDLHADDTWGVTVTIPPPQEEADGLTCMESNVFCPRNQQALSPLTWINHRADQLLD